MSHHGTWKSVSDHLLLCDWMQASLTLCDMTNFMQLQPKYMWNYFKMSLYCNSKCVCILYSLFKNVNCINASTRLFHLFFNTHVIATIEQWMIQGVWLCLATVCHMWELYGKQYNFRQKMFDTFIGNCSTSEQRKCSTTKMSTENVRHLL